MACKTDPDACRREHIARKLGLIPNPRSPGDFEGNCPVCGHGGFALSKPTLTRMRNMWSCNCKACHGRKGCPAAVIRAEMIRREIRAECLGSYSGKDRREISPATVRKMAQTIDDILDCPRLSGAEIRLLLADARGDEIPKEYGPSAAFLMSIGLGRSNAYNLAERETGGRPADQSPPQTRGAGVDTSRTTQSPNRVKPLRSETRTCPEIGPEQPEPSKNWTQTALADPSASPEIGQRTLDDKDNRRPAA